MSTAWCFLSDANHCLTKDYQAFVKQVPSTWQAALSSCQTLDEISGDITPYWPVQKLLTTFIIKPLFINGLYFYLKVGIPTGPLPTTIIALLLSISGRNLKSGLAHVNQQKMAKYFKKILRVGPSERLANGKKLPLYMYHQMISFTVWKMCFVLHFPSMELTDQVFTPLSKLILPSVYPCN